MKKSKKDPWIHIRIGMPDVYDGGVAGFLFLAGIILLCLRIPQTIPFLAASALLGIVIAVALRVWRI